MKEKWTPAMQPGFLRIREAAPNSENPIASQIESGKKHR
jgi:hypothetical protein